MMNRPKFVTLWCVLGISLLTACGTLDPNKIQTGADPAVVVAARAEARWHALIEGKLGVAYGYLSPATRKVMSLEVYSARVKPGLWRSVKADAATCDDELCRVNVMIKYDFREIKGMEMTFEEAWIKEDGNWWYVQKK